MRRETEGGALSHAGKETKVRDQYIASPSEYAVLLPYAELSSLYLAIFSL